MTTRSEHLSWCKSRAIALCDAGDMGGAITSMFSDLNKHPETSGHIGIDLGMALLVGGHLSDAEKVKKFIEDFN